jgi:hypothetical protein
MGKIQESEWSMKETGTLIDLLVVEECKAGALVAMQRCIDHDMFTSAMHYQFMYLYFVDECNRLHERFSSEYWDLRFMATGEPNNVS